MGWADAVWGPRGGNILGEVIGTLQLRAEVMLGVGVGWDVFRGLSRTGKSELSLEGREGELTKRFCHGPGNPRLHQDLRPAG